MPIPGTAETLIFDAKNTSSGNEINVQALLDVSNPTNTNPYTATTPKVFGVESSTANTFGVFDVKQVVKELSDVSALSTSTKKIEQMKPESLTNIESKTGMSIGSDSELEGATSGVSAALKLTSQKAFSGMDDGSPLRASSRSSSVSPFKSNSMMGEVNNFTSASGMRSFIPSSMKTSDYKSMQGMFGKSGLGAYNSCPDLTSAFINSLLDPASLLNMLKSLFGMVGMNDMGGVLNCVSSAIKQVDSVGKVGLMNTLVGHGSLNGLSSLVHGVGSGSITNKYNTVRSTNQNRTTVISPSTRRPTNSWTNPDVMTTAESLFDDLGVDKQKMFNHGISTNHHNPSITDRLADPVYDAGAIRDNHVSGFDKYCLGDAADVLSAAPSFQ